MKYINSLTILILILFNNKNSFDCSSSQTRELNIDHSSDKNNKRLQYLLATSINKINKDDNIPKNESLQNKINSLQKKISLHKSIEKQKQNIFEESLEKPEPTNKTEETTKTWPSLNEIKEETPEKKKIKKKKRKLKSNDDMPDRYFGQNLQNQEFIKNDENNEGKYFSTIKKCFEQLIQKLNSRTIILNDSFYNYNVNQFILEYATIFVQSNLQAATKKFLLIYEEEKTFINYMQKIINTNECLNQSLKEKLSALKTDLDKLIASSNKRHNNFINKKNPNDNGNDNTSKLLTIDELCSLRHIMIILNQIQKSDSEEHKAFFINIIIFNELIKNTNERIDSCIKKLQDASNKNSNTILAELNQKITNAMTAIKEEIQDYLKLNSEKDAGEINNIEIEIKSVYNNIQKSLIKKIIELRNQEQTSLRKTLDEQLFHKILLNNWLQEQITILITNTKNTIESEISTEINQLDHNNIISDIIKKQYPETALLIFEEKK
jgi:hypothetical protein